MVAGIGAMPKVRPPAEIEELQPRLEEARREPAGVGAALQPTVMRIYDEDTPRPSPV